MGGGGGGGISREDEYLFLLRGLGEKSPGTSE